MWPLGLARFSNSSHDPLTLWYFKCHTSSALVLYNPKYRALKDQVQIHTYSTLTKAHPASFAVQCMKNLQAKLKVKDQRQGTSTPNHTCKSYWILEDSWWHLAFMSLVCSCTIRLTWDSHCSFWTTLGTPTHKFCSCLCFDCDRCYGKSVICTWNKQSKQVWMGSDDCTIDDKTVVLCSVTRTGHLRPWSMAYLVNPWTSQYQWFI